MNARELDDVLGFEAARMFVAEYGGSRVWVPDKSAWDVYERNKALRERWKKGDTLEKLHADHPELSRKQLKRIVWSE